MAVTKSVKRRVSKMRVERDGSVVRAADWRLGVADFCAVAFLGRDFDVGFFAIAPSVSSFSEFSEEGVGPGEGKLKTQYVETARLRMGPSAIAHLTMNLLTNIRVSDPESYEKLRQNLDVFLEQDNAVVDQD